MTNPMRVPIVMLTATMLTAGLMSCDETGLVSYSHFEKIGTGGWDPADVISFEPAPADSTEPRDTRYEMELVLRSSARMGDGRIPLAVTIEDENGITATDTIAMQDTEWKERVSYGVRERVRVLDPDMTLTDGYAVSVSPLAPREESRGLLNVGLKLKRKN